MSRVIIIAEIGVNHNRDLGLAREMILAAAGSGADIIKFQTAIPELVQIPNAPKARYQLETTGHESDAMDMTRSFHFEHEVFRDLKATVDETGCEFLSTAFDLQSLDFLRTLQPRRWKIPSGEITNLPYLRKIASYGQQTIMSTGMCSDDEILWAIDILCREGLSRDLITVLQCTTAYPTPLEEANVNAMIHLQDITGCKVGFSDHTSGSTASIAAVALGASVIEKHFTTNKQLPGPDQSASMDPREFTALVKEIRAIETALGSKAKAISLSEFENRAVARRGVYFSRDLPSGTVITAEDLVCLRPESSISARDFDFVVGKTTKGAVITHQEVTESILE